MRLRKIQTMVAVMATAVLLLTIAAPAAARSPAGIAKGSVEWELRNGEYPDVFSVFRVRDGRPGEDSTKGDRGYYYLSRGGPLPGTLTIKVSCVRVEDGWAEFAGVATHATGIYVVGEVWFVSVVDKADWGEWPIGMKGKFPDLASACDKALDDEEHTWRRGIVTDGDIKVRVKNR